MHNKKLIGLIIIDFLLISLLISTIFIAINKKNNHTDTANHVSNDFIGLKFSIFKNFITMDSTELKRLNPQFVYGFKQADVENVECIVSQTSRTQSDTVMAEILRDGTFGQIKKNFPDAQLVDYQLFNLRNGLNAIKILVTYHKNNVLLKQIEVAATTDARTTFAFCTSPSSLYDYYQTKFDNFLSSLEVY